MPKYYLQVTIELGIAKDLSDAQDWAELTLWNIKGVLTSLDHVIVANIINNEDDKLLVIGK